LGLPATISGQVYSVVRVQSCLTLTRPSRFHSHVWGRTPSRYEWGSYKHFFQTLDLLQQPRVKLCADFGLTESRRTNLHSECDTKSRDRYQKHERAKSELSHGVALDVT
jgi:hypothetical protein